MGIVRRKKLRAGGGTDDGYIGTVDVKRYNFYSFFFTDFRGPRRTLFLLSLCFYCPYYFVGAAVRAGTYAFEKILCRAGPGMGKRYFGAGAGRRPGNARPRFQVWQPCGSCT